MAKKTFRFISSIISIRVRVREVYQVTYCGIDMVYIPVEVYLVYQGIYESIIIP